jgi:hypothetical protein
MTERTNPMARLFYLSKVAVMVFADDIRKEILRLADERGREKTFRPSDVARAVDEKNWRILLEQVRLVADSLIQEGKIIATEAGKVVDINQSKGPLRFRKN